MLPPAQIFASLQIKTFWTSYLQRKAASPDILLPGSNVSMRSSRSSAFSDASGTIDFHDTFCRCGSDRMNARAFELVTNASSLSVGEPKTYRVTAVFISEAPYLRANSCEGLCGFMFEVLTILEAKCANACKIEGATNVSSINEEPATCRFAASRIGS